MYSMVLIESLFMNGRIEASNRRCLMGRFKRIEWMQRVLPGAVFLLALLVCVGPGHGSRKYTLGMSAAFTGPSSGLGIELYRGSMAYFYHVNSMGGINGKAIVLEALDDGYQPDPAIQNTIRFMDDPTVDCLFNYVGTPTVTRILPLLKGYNEAGKLLFFPFTGAETLRKPPYAQYVFNLRASYQQELSALVNRLTDLGMTRLAVFYQADAYGRSGWDGARRALAAKGLEMVGEATYQRGTSFSESMRGQVAILERTRPDAILSIGSYAACAAFIRDARDAGISVPIVNVSFVGSENMVGLLQEHELETGRDYLSNLINTQVVPSYEDLSLPAVREYRELMKSYQPMPPDMADQSYRPLKYSFTSFEGFLNAKVMVTILRRLDGGIARNLSASAEFMEDIDLGIGTPIWFSPGRHQGLDRVYFTTVECGKFVPMTEEHWEQWRK